ncbi:MAG: carbon-phosphorus lyase complex subunit PhnI [Desulfovibrio sp.]|jgi:alpha-D-ribose 1-methylphosphonate 5-triphosphate synthase subunit PhnI|nr:carbon-phosphorus lyase complex subunit PhnI [Desulfovibrio sp.]
MYVAVKGGEKAIANAHSLLAEKRRGDVSVPEIGTAQIREQLSLAVDRVMSEGSLYDRDTAALAIKQARGDLVEAVFLVRAYRTTLPRFGSADPLDTESMRVRRRISATYKDVPGGQVLGPTFDYTHRLLDPALAGSGNAVRRPGEGAGKAAETPAEAAGVRPKVLAFLEKEGLLPEEKDRGQAPGDLTRQPLQLPADRDIRLQNLARGDEGMLLALAYSTQRGFGSTHPFAGEIRMGEVEVAFTPEELGFPVIIGEITVTECETVNKFTGGGDVPASFTRGYGLTFGEGERKAMSMALVDRSLRSEGLGEEVKGPAQDQEFVLYHSDNVEASGFVQHLKLPHYVDFQAELELVRSLRRAHAENVRSRYEPE